LSWAWPWCPTKSPTCARPLSRSSPPCGFTPSRSSWGTRSRSKPSARGGGEPRRGNIRPRHAGEAFRTGARQAMKTHRLARVAEAIREVASETTLYELRDPRVKMVTVTRAEVSGDLQHAKVYVSIMGTPKE